MQAKAIEFLRPITYDENIGSAQVKSCMILAALNTPGVSVFNTRASRNHTESESMDPCCARHVEVAEP